MQFLDMITALTTGCILAILTLYVVVVYKKGWLRRDLKEDETYFLCPNSKCRRVFKDPVWLTDLSKTPPESYQACPHCSISLQTSPSFVAKEKSPKLESKPRKTSLIKNSKRPDKPQREFHRESMPEKAEIIREIHSPTVQSKIPSKIEKSPEAQVKISPPNREISKQTIRERLKPHKKPDEKPSAERPRACSHHFGYVKTLPKNTAIPDECLWCPWIVDCLAGAKTVEA